MIHLASSLRCFARYPSSAWRPKLGVRQNFKILLFTKLEDVSKKVAKKLVAKEMVELLENMDIVTGLSLWF